MTTVRALLAVTTMENWKTLQMDVSNAFLRGELHKTIYMKLPQGYFDKGCRTNSESANVSFGDHFRVQTQIIIYDLKQSPRLWFHKLS